MSSNTREMLAVELPNGNQLAFETPEALTGAVAQIKAGTPVVVRSEKDGTKQVAVGEED